MRSDNNYTTAKTQEWKEEGEAEIKPKDVEEAKKRGERSTHENCIGVARTHDSYISYRVYGTME